MIGQYDRLVNKVLQLYLKHMQGKSYDMKYMLTILLCEIISQHQ